MVSDALRLCNLTFSIDRNSGSLNVRQEEKLIITVIKKSKRTGAFFICEKNKPQNRGWPDCNKMNPVK